MGGWSVKIGLWVLVLVTPVGCARQTPDPIHLPPLHTMEEQAPAPRGPDYRLRPGDVVRVKYLYHPELDIKLPVRPDGFIDLQVAGDVRAAGHTTSELEESIREKSSHRLREPEIAVVVAQAADIKIFVGGEVRVPGFVIYREGITPLQAIMDRGGFTDTARIDSVLRISPRSDDYEGARLDFTAPLSAGTPEDGELIPGDVLYVPRTFIGDVNSFVRLYIRGVLPIEPRVGAGTTF
jgi:protein involved in polysaccharide export with SLBB domain